MTATADHPLVCEVSIWDVDDRGSVAWRQGWRRGGKAATARIPHPAQVGTREDWATPTLAIDTDDDGATRVAILTDDALVVFGVACDAAQPAAVEVWQASPAGDLAHQLLYNWCSDAAAPLARASVHARLPWGTGLPGLAFEVAAPVFLNDLAQCEAFARGFAAERVGLYQGLAIPAGTGNAAVAFLSAQEPTLARRVALVAPEDGGLRCLAGYCRRDGELFDTAPGAPWGDDIAELIQTSDGPVLLTPDGSSASQRLLAPLQAEALLAWSFNRPAEVARTLLLWL